MDAIGDYWKTMNKTRRRAPTIVEVDNEIMERGF